MELATHILSPENRITIENGGKFIQIDPMS